MIKTKCIYEQPSPEDGLRLLIMRKWPRGIAKNKVHAWRKEFAPSEELLSAWRTRKINWDEFEKRYEQEMQEKEEFLKWLAERAEKETITLLCWERKDEYCHRRVLKNLIGKGVR